MGKLVGSITLTSYNEQVFLMGDLYSTDKFYYTKRGKWGASSDSTTVYLQLRDKTGTLLPQSSYKTSNTVWKVNNQTVSSSTSGVTIGTFNSGETTVPSLTINGGTIFGSQDRVLVEVTCTVVVSGAEFTVVRTTELMRDTAINEKFITTIKTTNNDYDISSEQGELTLTAEVFKDGAPVTLNTSGVYKSQWFIAISADLRDSDPEASDDLEDGVPDKNNDGNKDGWAALVQSGSRFIADSNSSPDYYTSIKVDRRLVEGTAVFKVRIIDSTTGTVVDEENVTIYDISDPYLVLNASDTQVKSEPVTITAKCKSRIANPFNEEGVLPVKSWNILAYRANYNNGNQVSGLTTTDGITVSASDGGSSRTEQSGIKVTKSSGNMNYCTFKVGNEVFGTGINKVSSVVVQVDAQLA